MNTETKSIISKVSAMIMMVIMLITGIASVPEQASAASKGGVKYQIKTINKSKSYRRGKYKVYHQYVKISGNTKAIKRINKHLKAKAVRFMKNRRNKPSKTWKKLIDSYYEMYGVKETMRNYIKAKVTYNKNGYISVKYTQYSYAGGVFNIDEYGETFNIKTGKRKKITSMLNSKYFDSPYGKYVDLQNAICRKLYKLDLSGENENAVVSYLEQYNTAGKISKQKFYLSKKGNVVCCFPTYDIASGSQGTIKVTLKGRL